MEFSFAYGDAEIRIPQEKEVLKNHLEEYITSTPKEHSNNQVGIYENLMEGVLKLSPEEEQAFIEITEKLITEIVNDEDTSIKFYKNYKEGWSSYTRFTGQYKTTSEEIKSMLIEFAENTTLYEVYSNSNDYLTMIGWSGLKFGRDMQKLPDFDFDSWYQKYNEKKFVMVDGETELELQVIKNNPKAFAKAYRAIMKSNKGKAVLDLKTITGTLLNLPSVTVKANIRTLEPFYAYPAINLEDYQESQIESKTKAIRDKKVYSGGWVTTSPTNKSTGSIMWGRGIAPNFNKKSTQEVDISKDIKIGKITEKEAVFSKDFLKEAFQKLMTVEFMKSTSLKDSTTTFKLRVGDEIFNRIKADSNMIGVLTGGGEEIDSVYLSKLEFKIKFPKMTPKKTAGKFENKVDAIIEATKKITLVPKVYRLKVAEWDSIPYSQESPNASEEMREHLDLLKERLSDLTQLGVEIKGTVDDESPALEKDGSIKEE